MKEIFEMAYVIMEIVAYMLGIVIVYFICEFIVFQYKQWKTRKELKSGQKYIGRYKK
jgi:putative flippase GtrA